MRTNPYILTKQGEQSMSKEYRLSLKSTKHLNESREASALQIELLETSFQAIVPCGEAFVTAFYERLFTRFPQTRAFFASTDMKEQRKKLLGALDESRSRCLGASLRGGQRHHAGRSQCADRSLSKR
jgi:hypothetical protein